MISTALSWLGKPVDLPVSGHVLRIDDNIRKRLNRKFSLIIQWVNGLKLCLQLRISASAQSASASA